MGQNLQRRPSPASTIPKWGQPWSPSHPPWIAMITQFAQRWPKADWRPLSCWLAIFLLSVGIMSLPPGAAIAAANTPASDLIAPNRVAVTAISETEIAKTKIAETDSTAIDGGKIFDANCAGCHLKGGNIIRRGKTLKLKALKRNHVDSLDAVITLVSQGKGSMSAYGIPLEAGGASRLDPDAIEAVSQYVLDQANAGWR